MTSNWGKRVEVLLEQYGNDFFKFTALDEDLVQRGNATLGYDSQKGFVKPPHATGYNIILFEHSNVLISNSVYVSYTNYIHNVDHISRLLSIAEAQEIVDPTQVMLVPRASAFYWRKSNIEQTPVIELVVEIMVMFNLGEYSEQTNRKIMQVTDFLKLYADAKSPQHIDDKCWEVPDFRIHAPPASFDAIDVHKGHNAEFQPVVLNVGHNERGSLLLVLRKLSQLTGWQHGNIAIFYRLAEFLTDFEVSP